MVPILLKPAARSVVLFAVAAACALVAPAGGALTRIEPTPIGIPGSGGELGTQVAIHGDTAAVAAPGAQAVPMIGSGSVNVYRRVGADWQREAVLLPADATDQMRFGTSLALGADVLVATAPAQSGGSPEAVYTFQRTGSTWQQVDRFTAYGDISLSGATLAIGDTIYVRAGTGWDVQAQLQADEDETIVSTVVDGDFALAWSSLWVSNFEIHNYAYLFHRSGGSWAREARIELGNSGAFDSPIGSFALSGESALVSWRNVVTAYSRAADATWAVEGVFDPLTSAPGFGTRVALDGDRALASSPGDTVYGWANAGTVYVFERHDGTWSRVAHVAHPGVNYYNYVFGSAIALDGDSMLVGAPGAYTEAGATGDATVFAEDGGGWPAAAILDAGNDHEHAQFGYAVAVSGSTVLVGAPGEKTDRPFATGAAYVFEPDGGSWLETAHLAPAVPYGHGFGEAVAIDQDTAVVGVSHVVGSTTDLGGAAYVFVRDGVGWQQQARLSSGSTDRVAFGAAVALHGDQVAVGEPGSTNLPGPGRVHLFERVGTNWSPLAIVAAADGTAEDRFGSGLAFAGGVLVVGAPEADVGIETDAGAVYVFIDQGGTWIQQARLTAPIPAKLGGFGRAVALAGDTLVVGTVDREMTRGAVHVYSLDQGVPTLLVRLVPAAGMVVSGSFGSSVAIADTADRIIVGQPRGDALHPDGRAFVFELGQAGWVPSAELAGSMPLPIAGDGFGTSVAASADWLAVGAPSDGRAGAVYVAGIGNAIFADGFDAD